MGIEEYILQYSRSGKEQEEEENTSPILLASISGKTIAFSQEGIKEVARCDSLIPIPGMPQYVLGLVNLRGEFEALFDFRSLFSIPRSPLPSIFEALLGVIGDLHAAIYIDAVLGLIDFPKNQIIPPPPDLEDNLKPLIIGEIAHEEDKILLLNFANIISRLVEKKP